MKKLYALLILTITTSLFGSLTKIEVETKDGKKFDTYKEYLKQSVTINDMLEDLNITASQLSLSLVSSEQWNEVAPLLKFSYEIKNSSDPKEKELDQFIAKKTDDQLTISLETAFFLDILNTLEPLIKAINKRLIEQKLHHDFLQTKSPVEYNPFKLNNNINKIIAQNILNSIKSKSPSPSLIKTIDKNNNGHDSPVISALFSNASFSIRKTIDDSNKNNNDSNDWITFINLLNPNGQFLFSASKDKTIKIWDISNPQKITPTETTSKENIDELIDGIKLSPINAYKKICAYIGIDNSIRFLNISNPQDVNLKNVNPQNVITRINNDSDFTRRSIILSLDGKLLASASGKKIIKIWNISDLQNITLIKTIDEHNNGHTDAVLHIAFSPDGQFLASASRDKTIKIWNISDLQNITLIKTIDEHNNGHTDSVNFVDFSPNGQLLASASDDKTIKIWSVFGKEYESLLKTITLPQALLLYYAAEQGGLNVKNESQGIQEIYNGFSNEIKSYLEPLIRQ